MKRREFITLLGDAGLWSSAAWTQKPALPVIGFLHPTSLEQTREFVAAFHRGLGDTGYVESKNVGIEYRWGQGHNDRDWLAPLIADLVRRQVSVIVLMATTAGALAAKAETRTIPIVFMQGADPVRIGLVDSLSHPGGNLTGINLLTAELGAKRLEFLLQLVPTAKSVAYLFNPSNPIFAQSETEGVQGAADTLGVELKFVNASSVSEIGTAFARLVEQQVDALFVSADGLFNFRSEQIVALASRHSVPATYNVPYAVEVGGLMSYSTDFLDAWRQVGVYTGLILNGAKPATLPVQQVARVQLALNLKTAKALGLTVPLLLLGRADKVIE